MKYNLSTIEGCTAAINSTENEDTVGMSYILRADLFSKQMNYSAAINDMEKGINILKRKCFDFEKNEVLKGEMAKIHFTTAEYCRVADKYEQAINHYEKAENLGMINDYNFYSQRAWCKAKLNRFREALLDIEKALQIGNKDAQDWQKVRNLFLVRGVCRRELGDEEGANNDFLFAEKINPKNLFEGKNGA